MRRDESGLPALDDPFGAYESWQRLHTDPDQSGGVAEFLIELLSGPPSPGEGKAAISVRDRHGGSLEVVIAWTFDRHYGNGRGLLRIQDMRSPSDPLPA